MTTACARSRTNVGLLGLIDCGNLRWRGNAQSLDVRSLSSRRKSWPRHADGVVEGGLVCHLSKTAGVHAHGFACWWWNGEGSRIGYTGVPKECEGRIVVDEG